MSAYRAILSAFALAISPGLWGCHDSMGHVRTTVVPGGVEIRAGIGERLFSERHAYAFEGDQSFSRFANWAHEERFRLSRALYTTGDLGAPPQSCREHDARCSVYSLVIGYDSAANVGEAYLVYVVDERIVRVDNAYGYPPRADQERRSD